MKSVIKNLNNNLINQIAAGEVVDNPSSIIKELIENSIDAKSTKIDLHIFKSGFNKIIIKDNGVGMNKLDLTNAFNRFSTSKINHIEDLLKIKTLGFRGEALSSIASISQVIIESIHVDENDGFQLTINNSKIENIKPHHITEGTKIEIRNIFYNVPARKKFLKSEKREYLDILKIFKIFSLSNPNIEFTLYNDNKIKKHYKKSNLSNRINDIFGDNYKNNLINVDYVKDNIKIKGYIGNLTLLKKRKGMQYSFVNNRYVNNSLIYHTVYNCFRGLLERGEYPFYVLNVTFPENEIDVNVHPKKLEIKFKNEHKLQYVIKKSISKSMKNKFEMIPKYLDKNYEYSTPDNNLSIPFNTAIESIVNETIDNIDVIEGNSNNYDSTDNVMINKDKKIWQIHNKYLITELKSSIIIIDQHVAHERILYELAKDALENNPIDPQTILFPQTIKFEEEEFLKLIDILPYIKKMGFDVRSFGENSIIVEGLPPEVSMGKEREIIKDILDHFMEHNKFNSSFIEYMAATFACKAAIKAGDKLEYIECAELIDKLFNTKHPYYCPHGRPIIINLTIDELDKRFERH